jgi:hypothetical protein
MAAAGAAAIPFKTVRRDADPHVVPELSPAMKTPTDEFVWEKVGVHCAVRKYVK